jgi:hypothetical protein
MRKVAVSIIIGTVFSCLFSEMHVYAQETKSQINSNFEPFTGKVTREKVRLRLQPSLESPVVKELSRNDLLIISGETEEFYAVHPPASIKGYVYRPYVLDGIIEGNRVNVRLSPHLEAPIIAQLNTGEKVEGSLSIQSNKWLEITPPKEARFYVASDYVEKVGDANFLSIYETRLQEANGLFNNTYIYSQNELQKPFPEINCEKVTTNYRVIIDDYKDFPEKVSQAKEALAKFQEDYLYKKIAFLEAKTKASSQENARLIETTGEKLAKQAGINSLSSSTFEEASNPTAQYNQWISNRYAYEVNSKMLAWAPVEIAYYQNWTEDNEHRSIQDFYQEEKKQSVVLQGIIEAYDRPIRNKPGDFLLINRISRLPIAYLYSTHINLQDKVGQEVTIEGIVRSNKNFAYPAYFVISVQ